MYKIVYKNPVLPVILLIFFIGASIGIEFATAELIPQVPVLLFALAGAIPIFLIATVMMFSKGKIADYALITLIMLVAYGITTAVTSGACIALGKQSLEGMVLTLNPVVLLLYLVSGIGFAGLLMKMEEVKHEIPVVKPVSGPMPEQDAQMSEQPLQEDPVPQPEPEPQPSVEEPASPQEDSSEPKPLYDYDKDRPALESQEEVFFEDIMDKKPEQPAEPVAEEKPLYDYDKDRPAQESQEEVFFEDIMEQKPEQPAEPVAEEKPLYDYDKDRPDQESKEEVFFEDIMEQKPEQPAETVAQEPKEEPRPQAAEPPEEHSAAGDLPSLDGDIGELPSLDTPEPSPAPEEPQSSSMEQPAVESSISQEPADSSPQPQVDQPEESSVPSDETSGPAEKPFIPKLSNEPSTKNIEGGGKITSIGKLLVDHRDIENIIETNALMQSVGSEATTTKIISAVAGTKTNEKLSALNEVDGIDASVIVNDAGFIQASTLGDIHKEQVVGAMASGTFGIISNSLTKMGFQPAKDITLETGTGSVVLNKISDNIITIFVDSDHSLYNLQELNEILVTAAEREHGDLIETISSISGLIGAILSNNNGDLIVSKLVDSSKKPEEIASILPAFYHNLSVFIGNMNLGTFRKAIVSTGNEILLFTSIGTNILMLYATLNTIMLPNDVRIQYETIINA